jgi:hypothetical protein
MQWMSASAPVQIFFGILIAPYSEKANVYREFNRKIHEHQINPQKINDFLAKLELK